MYRSLLLSAFIGVYALTLAGCDCGDDVVLEIVEPQDGATFNLASDVDTTTPEVQIVVLVATEGLDLGANVDLIVGTETMPGKVAAGGAVRYEVTLAEGDTTLVARAEGQSSSPVTVTLDATSTECPDLSITKPDRSILTAADDEDEEECGTFTYTVIASTNAQAGRGAELWINGNSIADAVVEGAEIRFEAATLDPGANDIEVRLVGEGDCSAAASATVDCGVTCSISDPTGDVLNAEADDDTGEPGMQKDFTVATDAEDGQSVQLLVDDEDAGSAEAQDSEARLEAVSLAEGERVVQAVCTDAAGNESRSSRVRFLVDSVLPRVSITQPREDDVFNLSRDDDPLTAGVQVRVCATSDEAGDFCAAVAGGAPGADGCDDAPVEEETCGLVDCAGNGVTPVVLEARVTDSAGNETIESVEVLCDTGTPVAAISDPRDGRLLSGADDQNLGLAGMQYAVAVCTDAAAGTEVELFQNGQLRGSAEVVDVECSAPGLGAPVSGTATFTDFALAEGTVVLRAEVPSPGGNRGISPEVRVDVDTVPPSVSWLSFDCGVTVLSPSDDADGDASNGIQLTVDARVTGAPDNSAVDGTITHADASTDTFSDDSIDGFGFASFPDVTFQQGVNTLSITIADAAGNVGVSPDCAIIANVGGYIRIDSPAVNTVFSMASDGNQGVAGYQGAVIRVVSDGPVNGMDVRVLADGVQVGRRLYDNAGGVDLTVDLPEGAAGDNSVNLTAETIGHPSDPIVSGVVRVLVDTVAPETPAGVVASPVDVRSGAVSITFTAPADPVGRTVTSYQVRQSPRPFVGENDGAYAAAQGAPVAPGASQPLTLSMFPGASYYFAVRAVDAVGNVGASGFSGLTTIAFTADTIESPNQAANFSFGYSIAGGGDINDDGFDDLVVGSIDGGNRAYVFYGSLAGIAETPDVTLDGSGGAAFGSKVALLTHMNNDAFADIVVGDYTADALGEGRVYVFFGGANLPASMTTLDAGITISGADADVWLGSRLSPAGDVNNDGYSDLLVGGVRYGSNLGEAFVILGEANPPAALSMPTDADLRILGTIAGDRTAFVAPAGRLDADDLDDFIVSGCRGGRNGHVYVFLGEDSASLAADPTRDATEADFTFASPDANDDQYGCAVAGVGDVDDDGFGDIAVGANMHGAADTGVAYLYLSNGVGGFDAPLTYSNAGANSDGDRLGNSIPWTLGLEGAPEPSVDADTHPDLALGEQFFGLEPGGLVFFNGAEPMVGGDISNARGRAQEPAGSYYAFVSGYAGDIDGDGYVDFFAGDPYVTVGGSSAVGRAYVVR